MYCENFFFKRIESTPKVGLPSGEERNDNTCTYGYNGSTHKLILKNVPLYSLVFILVHCSLLNVLLIRVDHIFYLTFHTMEHKINSMVYVISKTFISKWSATTGQLTGWNTIATAYIMLHPHVAQQVSRKKILNSGVHCSWICKYQVSLRQFRFVNKWPWARKYSYLGPSSCCISAASEHLRWKVVSTTTGERLIKCDATSVCISLVAKQFQ